MEDLSLVGVAHCTPPMMGSRANMLCSVGVSVPSSFPDSEAGCFMEHDSQIPAVAQLRGLEASAKQVGHLPQNLSLLACCLDPTWAALSCGGHEGASTASDLTTACASCR